MGVVLFLHHLLYAFPSFAVGDVDKIDARRKVANVHRELFAFAFGRGHALAEGVEHFGLLEVFAPDGDEAGGGVGIKVANQILFFLKVHINWS